MAQCTLFYLIFWFTVYLYVLYMQDEEHFLAECISMYVLPSAIELAQHYTHVWHCTYAQYLLQRAARAAVATMHMHTVKVNGTDRTTKRL